MCFTIRRHPIMFLRNTRISRDALFCEIFRRSGAPEHTAMQLQRNGMQVLHNNARQSRALRSRPDPICSLWWKQRISGATPATALIARVARNVVFSAEKCRYSPNRETRVSSNARIVEIKTSNGRLLRLCTACTDLKIALAQSLNVNAITPAFTQQSVQSVTINVIRFNLAWLNNKFSTAKY